MYTQANLSEPSPLSNLVYFREILILITYASVKYSDDSVQSRQSLHCSHTKEGAEMNAQAKSHFHEISNNVVCATSKDLDQPAHTRSLIIAFASRLNIL